MKNIVVFIMLLAGSVSAWSQSRTDLYLKLDSTQANAQEKFTFLKAWEKAEPLNSDMCNFFANYYFNKSAAPLEYFEIPVIKTEYDSNNKITGYTANKLRFSDSLIQKSLIYINKGIALNPNRMDLLAAKMGLYAYTRQDDKFGLELMDYINRVYLQSIEWVALKDKIVDSPRLHALDVIYNYFDIMGAYDGYNDDILQKACNKIREFNSTEPGTYFYLGQVSIDKGKNSSDASIRNANYNDAFYNFDTFADISDNYDKIYSSCNSLESVSHSSARIILQKLINKLKNDPLTDKSAIPQLEERLKTLN